MRYALLGDVHANLPALEAVLEAVKREKVDEYVQAGDMVGYGAQPVECVQRLRSLGFKAVRGNHEAAVIGDLSLDYFNPYAREAALWTQAQVGGAERAFLQGLPLTRTFDRFSLAHGTLHAPEDFNYMMSIAEAEKTLALMDRPICFVAHSHIPVSFFGGATTSYSLDATIPVDPNVKTVVNVGSVGQPRDDDPRAAYAVYDTEQNLVWIKRVEYDIERAAEAILKAGLPKVLADRLKWGR